MLAAIANLNLNLLTEVNHDVHHCVSIYMGREGFEPPKAEPPNLQSGSINHSDTYPNIIDTLCFSPSSALSQTLISPSSLIAQRIS